MKLGFWEILVVVIVALLVIGPDKLPYYAKKFGIALKEFRKVSEDMTKEVRESVIRTRGRKSRFVSRRGICRDRA